jgi:hypothetical protein
MKQKKPCMLWLYPVIFIFIMQHYQYNNTSTKLVLGPILLTIIQIFVFFKPILLIIPVHGEHTISVIFLIAGQMDWIWTVPTKNSHFH